MKKRIVSIMMCCVLLVSLFMGIKTVDVNAAITVFSQTDSRWANHPYGFSNTAGTQRATISSGGCGILSLVNAVYYLNGKFIEPNFLADYSVNNGHRVNGVGTALSLYEAFSKSYGSTYGIKYAGSTNSYSTLESHLNSGGVAIGSAPGHLMAVVDYDSSTNKFLILDSFKSSNRYTYNTGYTWQTKSSCCNTPKLNFSTFILINKISPDPDPDPSPIIDSKYSKYMPLTAYLSVNNTVYPCNSDCTTSTGGEIWTTDECTINAIYTNGWCKVNYPTSSGSREGFTQISNYITSTNLGLVQKTANCNMNAYNRADMSNSIGSVSSGDACIMLGTSGNATQVIYPTAKGYKLGWTASSNWIETPMPGYDERFNPYCPIKGYIKGTTDVTTYAADFSTPQGEIWESDYCTIDYVYDNGWCKVTYPSVESASGTATAYVPLSAFVHDTASTPVSYIATSQINVYTRADMSNTPNWWISAGDKFYNISTSGSVCQVLYPVDAQYGGGYKIGWVNVSQLPVTTYTVNYNANGGSGEPSSQTKKIYETLTLSSSIPSRTGYDFAGWATSSSSTVVDYAPGSLYSDNSSLTLYAIWNPVKYEIKYDFNGGYANIANQVKAHNSNITLSSEIPEKVYGIYCYAYEDELENTSKIIDCEFLGWSTSNNAATATYKSGELFSVNENVTLYAVYSNPVLGDLETPTKDGYTFLGWYTAETGGNKVTETSVITEDTTIYAHWKDNETPSSPNTYTVSYDANGGSGAPSNQTKTEDVELKLSTVKPTREGYIFKGWTTASSGENVVYDSGATYTANSDITLYAVWEEETADIDSPKFIIDDINAKAGSTVKVDVTIENNPGITAFNFSVDYPMEVLTLENVEYNALFSSKATGSKTMESPFIISWFSTLSEDEAENGVIATLTFKVKDDVTAGNYNINLTYDKNNIFDSTFTNISFATNNSEVTIKDYIPGDVNGDSNVNMKDVVLLQQFLNDWNVEIDENAANVNGDTLINMKDIVLLQQYLNDWDVTLV